MMDTITLAGERASEIFKEVNGIGGLLKTLPAKPKTAAVMYAITSNLAVIRMNLVTIVLQIETMNTQAAAYSKTSPCR